MRIYLFILFACAIGANGAKLSSKKSPKILNPQSAIIAIQIIDPHENKTGIKNSKRTIDSSLGYGHQGIFGGKESSPRYEVYKYSQHDIPPHTSTQYTGEVSQNYDNQNSVPKSAYNAPATNSYQPGTVLFSTINQQGKLGELSTQFPLSLENQQYPIPVIILRIHPEQLANPIYPQLPQNHLHASAINSIDITSLLSNYITSNVKQVSEPQYHPQQPQYQSNEPQYQTQDQAQYQQQYQSQDQAQYQQQYQSQDQSQYQQQYQPQDQAQYQQQYQEPASYAQPQVDSSQYQNPEYDSQQYYSQYQYEGTQPNVDSQKVVPQLPEPRSPAVSSYQYSNYQQSPSYQQSAAATSGYKSTELLTHENYPSEKHTQIIFKRSKGKSSKQKQPHRSVTIQSTKSQGRSQENQLEPEGVNDYGAKYVPPTSNANYPVQYQDPQQYSYKNAPRYEEEQQDAYQSIQPSREVKYIYISATQPLTQPK